MTAIVNRIRAVDADSGCFLVLYLPQPLMCCHQAFLCATLSTTWSLLGAAAR